MVSRGNASTRCFAEAPGDIYWMKMAQQRFRRLLYLRRPVLEDAALVGMLAEMSGDGLGHDRHVLENVLHPALGYREPPLEQEQR